MHANWPPHTVSDSSDDDDDGAADRPQRAAQRRQQQSKEAQMLGMWASDDSDRPGLGGSSARASRSRAARSERPTVFVAAQRPAADTPAVSSDPSSNASSGSSGSSSDSDSPGETASSGLGRPNTGSAPAQRPNKNFGKFANSAVWRMMAKMGYTPGQGLGKHGEGRIEPVEVQQRPSGEGIAFSRSEKPTTHPQTARPRAPGPARQRERGPAGAESEDADAAAARRKVEYRTLEELEHRTEAHTREIFVDMATNTEAGSLAELLAARLPLTGREKLASDALLGLDMSFARLEDLARAKAAEEHRCRMHCRDVESLTLATSRWALKTEGLRAVEAAVAAVGAAQHELCADDTRPVSASMALLCKSFEQLRAAATATEERCGFDAWTELRLERVVTGCVYKCFSGLFDAWDPSAAPELYEELVDPLAPYLQAASSDGSARMMTPLESLLTKMLVPRLKQFVYTEWDPSSDDGFGRILARLPPAVGAAVSSGIGAVLRRTAEKSNPRVAMARFGQAAGPDERLAALSPLRFDRMLIPWLPFVADPSELQASVRRKLCTALDCWGPSKSNNDAVMSLVSPWMDVLHGKGRAKLAKAAAARLNTMLRANLEFNAHQQALWPFKLLVKWHCVLPLDAWVPLAMHGVLDRFLDYLRRWLAEKDANYAEIADWYWQWKLLFPPNAVACPEIQGAFREALVCMAFALEQRPGAADAQ